MAKITLDEAIRHVLIEAGRSLTVAEITSVIRARKLYLRQDGNPPERSQVSVRIHGRPALFEIDRSAYPTTIRLAARNRTSEALPAVVAHAQDSSELGGSAKVTDEWWWEGNIQARVIQHLIDQGWTIKSEANTATKARGADIVAALDDEILVVEVKGYPSKLYRSGPNEGRPKKTNPRLQAKHWFAEALLSAILCRESNSSMKVAMAFPDVSRYRDLVDKSEVSLRSLKLGVYLVPHTGLLVQRIAPSSSSS